MNTQAGENKLLLRLQLICFFIITAAIPLIITKLTYNQSDLPKSAALIVMGSIFFLLTALNFILSKNIKINIVPLTDIPVTAFLFAVFISYLFSVNHYNCYFGEYERHIGLIVYVILFLVYISASFTDLKDAIIKKLCFVMEITAALAALYAVFQQAGTDPFALQPQNDTRPVSTIGNAVFAGGFLALVLPVSALNLAEKKNVVLRYLLPGIILAGIFVTRTRSAYIAASAEAVLGIILLIFVLRKKTGLKKIILFSAVILALIIIFTAIFPHNIFSERVLSLLAPQNNPRWLIWRDALGIFYKYPVTGPGPGNFPTAFAEFYSYALRYDDVNRYIDNAHNNYLQILCTTGIIGLAGYLSVIAGALIICIRKVRSEKTEEKVKLFYAALLISITGYLFYSLTNFDEISIMLYFTVILILIRSRYKSKSIGFSTVTEKIIAAAIIFLPAILFSGYNSYIYIRHISADVDFRNGMESFNNSNFKEGINSVNKAITSWPQNPVYRYSIASEVLRFVKLNPKLDDKNKLSLLMQAGDEVLKAKNNHSNQNACDALLSLIYFESGRSDEGENLKNAVLKKDEVNIVYRINLAYYYISKMQYNSSLEQINYINRMGYRSVNFWLLSALYYYSTGNNEESRKFIDMVRQKEPGNTDAARLNQMIDNPSLNK